MVLLTIIARQLDGLPLAASVPEDEQKGRDFMEYQTQAKQLLRKIATSPSPPERCSFETGPYLYHYMLERGVCYLVLCDKAFSKRLAFTYLEDLQSEFQKEYGARVHSVTRPYSFIEFDTYMLKQRKSYTDSRVRRNLRGIDGELQDVQRVMVQNIEDVLRKGELLTSLDSKVGNLSLLSQNYMKNAKDLNQNSSHAKIGIVVIVVILLVVLFRYFVL